MISSPISTLSDVSFTKLFPKAVTLSMALNSVAAAADVTVMFSSVTVSVVDVMPIVSLLIAVVSNDVVCRKLNITPSITTKSIVPIANANTVLSPICAFFIRFTSLCFLKIREFHAPALSLHRHKSNDKDKRSYSQ